MLNIIKVKWNKCMVYCDFEDIFGKWKVTKYLGGSKWINQVLVIKKTSNENC